MKYLMSAVALTIALSTPARAAQLVDYVVAVVNEDVILNSQLEEAVDSIKRQIRASGNTPPTDTELREQMRERLIMQEIQSQRAAQRGIRIGDEELNQALEGIARQNGMNLREFARALRSEGVDFLMVREQVRNELLTNSLRQREIDARVSVTDREIDAFLAKTRKNDQATEYRLEHILIAVPDGSTDDVRAAARAEAEQIRQAVIDGASFSQMAISRSDATTALDGGDLGWRTAGALPTLFADEVDDMYRYVRLTLRAFPVGPHPNFACMQVPGRAARHGGAARARHHPALPPLRRLADGAAPRRGGGARGLRGLRDRRLAPGG